MTTQAQFTDWTAAIKAFGEANSWCLPARRRLRHFRQWCDENGFTEIEAYGFGAAAAFDRCFTTLRDASDEEREACQTYEDVKALANRQDEARRARLAASLDAARAELMTVADEPGWTLVAGEDTTVVARGTLSDVQAHVLTIFVKRLRRDRESGHGAWVLLAPQLDGEEDRREAASGYFDAHTVWQERGCVPIC